MKSIKKVSIIFGLVVLICGGIVVILSGFNSLYKELTKTPKLAEMYDVDPRILKPSIYFSHNFDGCVSVDCDDLNDGDNIQLPNITISD